MADESTNYEINVVGNADGVKETVNALGDMQDQAREGAKVFTSLAKAAERAEKFTAGFTKAQQEQNRALKDGVSGLSAYQQAAARLAATNSNVRIDSNNNPRYVDTGKQLSNKQVQEELRINQLITQELDRQEAELRAQMAVRKENLKLMRDARAAGGYAPGNQGPQTGVGPGSAQAVAQRFQASGLFSQQDAQAAKDAEERLLAVRDANIKAAEAALLHANRLTNMRYSLYEVANTATLTAAALAAINVGTLAAAATYETAMAQISRTSDATGEQLRGIREDFVELAQTIPGGFGNLAEIGTLAGQLNISAQNIAAFTETTAKFTAATNVSAEASATAFGRLDALLDDVNGNYEALGSSILEVGVNSVATETEIIATTNQITAAAQQAGFAADEIIGLAASFASLGVAPEASRGTVIRVFSTINTAVTESNENLAKLAQYAGQSAEQFAAAWEGDPATAFQAVLNGMQGASDAGENLETVIRSMGITAVRDINALLKLAQNADIVASNFGYAAQGFNDATALGEAFEVQAGTLAAKVEVLGQSLQAFFATLGESGLGPVGVLVDMLNGMLKIVTDLAASPFVQWAAATVGVLTALGAVAAIIVAGISRLAASVIAGSQAMAAFRMEVAQATGQTLTFKTAMDYASTSMTGSATAARVLRTALLGLGVFGVIAVAGGVVAEVIDGMANNMKSAEEKAKDYFGALDGLGDALSKDTAAAREGAVVYGEVEGSLTTITRTTADWAEALTYATGSQINAEGAIVETTGATADQTLKIGENTAAWLASKIATDEAVISFLKFTDEMAKDRGVGFDQKGFLTAMVQGDVQSATALVEDFQARLRELDTTSLGKKTLSGAFGSDEEYNRAIESLNSIKDALGAYDGALATAADQTNIYNQLLEITGQSQDDQALAAKYGADALDEFSGAAATASDYASQLRTSVENAFSEQNIMAQWVNDSYALATGIAEGGNAFNYLSAAGIDNLNNLQTSIVSTIQAGAAMGASTTESVAALFLHLQQMGVDTANLMSTVAGIAGTTVGAIESAMAQPSSNTSYMAQMMAQIQANANRAAAAVGGGGGGGGGGGSRRSLADSAKTAQKEVRTLVDYANDLSKVMDRSWEIRFGFEESRDSVAEAFNNMVEEAADARSKVKGLRSDINGLKADLKSLRAERNSLNYFLSVANEYGDTLRATEIGAEIGQVNADIRDTTDEVADKKNDLKKTEDSLTRSIKGNSQAAIENRQKLRDLAQQHQAAIIAFAKSGASQAELSRFVKQSEREFMAQAAALGFARADAQKYSRAFVDMRVAIDNIPRKITVRASTSPAVQALNEFRATAKLRGEQAGKNVRKGFARGLGGKLPGLQFGSSDVAPLRKMINDQIKSLRGLQAAEYARNNGNGNGRTNALGRGIKELYATLNSLGFKSGGYTGGGGVNDVMGVVHGREFVVNAENTAKFRPILEAMNKGRMPAMIMPQSTGYTELSPYDRALLRNLSKTQINVNGRVLGEATSVANFQANRRGVS